MADSERKNARKTTGTILLVALAILVVVGGIIVVRGCHQPNSMEEQIDPDDQLPGTLEGTGSNGAPGAVPLLPAA
jgi:hypothetical protein